MPPVADIIKGARRIVVIEAVTDTTNIGAIFRSAAALGIDAVVLTRDSCDPLNRRAVRVSMGSVFLVPWTWLDEPVKSLQKLGFKTAAMALSDNSISLDDPQLKAEERLALVNARDAPDVRLCERLHAVDGDALEHKERRVDDDRQEHGRRGEQRHALDEASRTASPLPFLPSPPPCVCFVIMEDTVSRCPISCCFAALRLYRLAAGPHFPAHRRSRGGGVISGSPPSRGCARRAPGTRCPWRGPRPARGRAPSCRGRS